MRSFFWLLVIVNLAYLGWRYLAPAIDERSGPDIPPQDPPTLSLISELPRPPQPRLPYATSSQPQPRQQTQAQVQDGDETDRSRIESSAEAVDDDSSAETEIAQIPAESSRSCAVVAGFASNEPATVLVRTLKEGAGIDAYTLNGDEAATSVWWVYLPTFASEELARRTLAELREKGIDSYYLSSGELAGGISLGVFSRREGAERTQQEIARRGYSASIKEMPRGVTRYRVVAEATREAVLAEPAVVNFLENNPGLDVSDFVCEGVAEPK